ncbi:MAG TPA: hypothetical protein DEQ62_05820 [Verrucomicrobiales bacterium]|nr:hypothetical protein [Verrucomicrobiales bacterium]|tara:strand:- start:258 stop:1070 length:813 start_codon:yes stop_codon:yes gene_type:complete
MESENPKPEPQSQSTPVSAAAWRWPIVVVVLAMMVLVAYIVSLKTAKDAAAGTIRETRETIAEIGEAAVTIAENFQQAKITETFIESLPEVSDAGEGRLEVATLENTKVFKRSNTRTILWNKINLGTTVTEIKVPATFRYHIDLSAEWKIEVRDQQCIVIAPMLLPTTPVAIHTDKIEKRSENGWARFNADEQMDGLMQSITPRLTSHASSDSHLNLVREHARKTVAEFVRQWLMKEDHWREDRFRTVTVIFAEEAEVDDFPAKPTLQLN